MGLEFIPSFNCPFLRIFLPGLCLELLHFSCRSGYGIRKYLGLLILDRSNEESWTVFCSGLTYLTFTTSFPGESSDIYKVVAPNIISWTSTSVSVLDVIPIPYTSIQALSLSISSSIMPDQVQSAGLQSI